MANKLSEKMRIAAEWLRYNEAEDDERVDCYTVAKWLDEEANRRDMANAISKVTRATGIPTAIARAGIKRCMVKQQSKEA